MFDHIEAFHRPGSVAEAVRLLHEGKGKARFLASGTDVVVQRDRSIRALIDLTRLGLNYVNRQDGGLAVGAMTTMADLENSSQIRGLADGILAKAASLCGPMQNRNMATVGGNLANASPAADTATPLLVLDAVAVLARPRKQQIPLAKLFTGPRRTVADDALLVEILIPALPSGGRSGWCFNKLGRTQSDISVINVAAGLQVDRRGHCKWARIALGAAGPTPLRATRAEDLLVGRKIDAGVIEEACEMVTHEVSPVTDIRATAEYRREMCRVLTRRALWECAAKAGCAQ